MNIACSFLAAIVVLSSLPPATGATIQFEFLGTLDEVPAILGSQFEPGQLIAGTFSVETTQNGFLYDAAGLSLTIAGSYRVTGQAGSLRVLDDFGGSFDVFHASFDGPLTGREVNGLNPVEFDLGVNLPVTAFSSESVPTFIPLDMAVGVPSSIDFAPDDSETLTFRVTKLAAVPEPSAALSVMGGLGMLLGLARRRAA